MASSIEWGIGGEKEVTWAPRSKSSRPVGAASRSKGNSLGSAWLRKRYQSPGSIESSAAASEANEGARWDQPDRASAVSPPVVHVALPPYLSIRLRCSALASLLLPLAPQSTPLTCACRERARMCENGERVCGAHRRNDLDHSGRRRASQPPLLPGQNRLTCRCQAPKSQNSSEKGRRSRDARRRRSLRRSPDPTDTSAHRSSPRAGPRSLPSSAWSRVALPYC